MLQKGSVTIAIFIFLLLPLTLTFCGSETSLITQDNTVSIDPPVEEDGSFTMVSGDEWDETAVRKVLFVFAFGGFATDSQITTWASMNPGEAIVQMLTLDTTNPYLSPAESDDSLNLYDVTLTGLSTLWSANSSTNGLRDSRDEYEIDSWDSPEKVWYHAASKRGLNPVRQLIGLWETNYHLAVNQDANVSNRQIYHFYDSIMNALASREAYQNVLALAGSHAAVATQYNHKENLFMDARFEGNEDFAREFHQLYFGILGDYDPDYHELTTIKNTAKALTDMEVEYISGVGYSDEITYGTQYHYPSSLEILGETISGATAEEKLYNLAQYSMEHEESLDNLPIMIVRGLADDNLDDEKIAAIQLIWQSMGEKNLLSFIRKYAISTTFHSETRVKYWSSIMRNMMISNQLTLTNTEGYLQYYYPHSYIANEDVEIFRPSHDVFGNQTGLEASDTGDIFKEAYNRSVTSIYYYYRYLDEDQGWEKNWASIIPTNSDGTYRVKEVGEWLWQHFVADGLKNFGTLERAYVYALLGSGKDFGYFVDSTNATAVYTAEDIESDFELQSLYGDMEIATLDLNNSEETLRQTANYRVGLAIGFISATPYVFVQEGK